MFSSKPFVPKFGFNGTEPTPTPTPNPKPMMAESTPTPPPKPSKPWYQSKTMWFNLAVTGLGIASSAVPFLKPFVNPKTFGMLTTAVGMGNMALRAVTNTAIASSKTEQDGGTGRE